MTLFIDRRKGSRELYNYIRDVPKELGVFDGDFELLGSGPENSPMIVGGEYKRFTEALTAMNDGRVYGTQIARMLQSYGRVYLLIEGRIRVANDGVLEYFVKKHKNKEIWYTAYGRDGRGWTAREFFGRLESIEEFTGVRVRFAEDKQGSARLLENIYRYWQKDYSDHRSWMAWDQSSTGRAVTNTLIPTSNLPLVTRCARELAGIGQGKAHAVGAEMKTLAQMVLASEDDWARVEMKSRIKTGPKKGSLRTSRFSKETIESILSEIWTGKTIKTNSNNKED